MIPMALVGVMFMVVMGTFEWASLKLYQRVNHRFPSDVYCHTVYRDHA